MATYSPSKITKDGNTYNFTDTTKIPLAGTNALSGSIIPSTDNAYDLGSNSYSFNRTFTLYVQGNNTKELSLFSSNNTYDPWNRGAYLGLFTNDYSAYAERTGTFTLMAVGLNDTKVALTGTPSGTLTWGSKNVAMAEDVVPRNGGAVLTGAILAKTTNNSWLALCGGTNPDDGCMVQVTGQDNAGAAGRIYLRALKSSTEQKDMYIYSSGTWIWNGTACQITSDQRLKQQITEIDDKLLDAWEDVDLVQFKYNDAVDQKKDKARLHTGYVVQQIDEACKSHGVDVSKYGLYCHEEYAEETEEVEIESEDGTKTKEKKVIREASEHYSLRYTETLIVECAYLRKCIKELRGEIEQLKSSK